MIQVSANTEEGEVLLPSSSINKFYNYRKFVAMNVYFRCYSGQKKFLCLVLIKVKIITNMFLF